MSGLDSRFRFATLPAIALGFSAVAGGQGLADRVAAASSGAVQFTFAARAGVCGNGRTYYSIDGNSFHGDFSGLASEQCAAGPVRVVLDVSDRTVVGLHTFVGPVSSEPGVTSIGSVGTAAATDYLLSLASSSEGRVGSEALSAALLADSVELSGRLLSIAKDDTRPLETRRSALSALTVSTPAQTGIITQALIAIARGENEPQSLRQRALSVLARLAHGEGVPALIQLTGAELPGWVGREGLTVLARSGDPRARDYLRGVIQRTDLPEDVLAVAIRGFGQQYVTARDAELLRGLFPKLTGSASSEAVLSALGELGGTDNVRFLLGIVHNEQLAMDTRRRALQFLTRAGVSTSQLVGLYDATPDLSLREALISMYARLGEKAATEKLIAIARGDDNLALRRHAISGLSRNNDPAVRAALEGIVQR
jgi:HEAT repeat protein